MPTTIQLPLDNRLFGNLRCSPYVRKKEICARIHIPSSAVMVKVLLSYKKLHDHTCIFFESLYDSYYDDAVKDNEKRAVFERYVLRKLAYLINTSSIRKAIPLTESLRER
jgi:hypothetical protein